MNNTITSFVLVVLAVGISSALIQQPEKGSPAETKSNGSNVLAAETISVVDFTADNVIGYLGQPLGTVVRITGMALDGDSTNMKRNIGKTLLEVHKVNGKELKEKVVFDFHRAGKSVGEPKLGKNFDYYAHESGAFDGVVEPPDELGIDSPRVAHDGFYYRPRITIHKSNN